jgi:hypothetical protein
MPVSQRRQAYLGRIVTITWNRAGTMSSRSAFAIGLEPMAPQWLTLADLDHIGAAAGADLVLRLDHLFDPRQVVWQMAKIALGRRSPRFAVGIVDDTGINCGFGFSDGRLKVFKCQLACVRVELFGLLAVKGMAQFGDALPDSGLPSNREREVILPFGLGTQTRHFGLHGQKRLSHGRWKSIQIKGLRGRSGHAPSYPSPPQKPIFTR